MTKLKANVSREIPQADGNRSLVVMITPRALVLKGKGTRRRITVPYEKLVLRIEDLPPEIPARYTQEPLRWLMED